jgi:hypothetical protein
LTVWHDVIFFANLGFNVGFCKKKAAKDQVADYAERKDFGLEEAERWLAPVLNYGV